MVWENDDYVRRLLDGRERWGTVLSVTTIAGLLVFLWDRPHRSWLNLVPFIVGLCGTVYVLAVNSYYEQAEGIANARNSPAGEAEVRRIKAICWIAFARQIGFLGWFNVIVPVAVGAFATLAL
ncbi:MAG: hypothetical protein AB7Q45_09490 [Planctomycetaceae bacterium]